MSQMIESGCIDYDHGISAVDSGYQRALMDAIHLLIERDHAAVVDTGTQHSVPRVLVALAGKGLAPEAVEWVILTHVHLDHAGGAGALMRACPKARLAVHPRGARHMIDPSKLVAGTIAVYGAQQTRRLYGDIVPVPAERVVETPHGTTLMLGGRALEFYDAPGHARHHCVIRDTKSGRMFTGDVFGISYRELDEDGRQFVFPSTTPVQFDPEAFHRSIDLVLAQHPDAVYATHYSELRDIVPKGAILHRLIDAHAALALREKDAGTERHARLKAGVQALLLEEARRFGSRLADERIVDVYAADIELNAQGLGAWLEARV